MIAATAVAAGQYSETVREAIRSGIAKTLSAEVHAASITGTVSLAARDYFFIESGDLGFKILSSQNVKPGESVAIKGTPVVEYGRVAVQEKSMQRLGSGLLRQPKSVSLEELVATDGSRPSINWRRVTVAGRVIGCTEHGFALSVSGVPVTAELEPLPEELADCGDTHPKVVVRGVVEQVLDPAALFGGADTVIGLRLHIDRATDVSIAPDLEYLLRRRDGIVRKLLFWSVPVLSLALLGFLLAIFRQRRRLLLSRTIMAERKRMADDIHDTIEQHLVGAKMLLQLGRNKEASEVLVRAKREIRDVVWGLKNDDMMRLTPAAMLRDLAHTETTKGLYRVDTKLDSGMPAHLDASKMRDLSLIVREAIGNAVKHGGAKHIAISSDPLPDNGWRLRLANDGAPFDPRAVPGASEGHFGLEGMRERARRLGGALEIAPRKTGMVITLEVAGK